MRQESSRNFTNSAGCVSPEERERGDRFLAAYHLVEQLLRKMSGNGTRESFRHLVDEMSKENAVVRRYRDDLVEFAELRNAIVHERISPDYLIAVPLLETVERIEEIARVLASPPTVYPRFRKEVAVFSPRDSLKKVFQVMHRKGFTQFPVYEDGVYRGLLTDRSIARWVAGLMAGGMAKASVGEVLSGVSVDEVLASEKNPHRARFVSRRSTVYEVEEIFREASRRERWRVAAVLITENGNPEEELLGIVTPSDLLSFSNLEGL
ncbi:MAG: CBS domain-containing protein [Bacillota bacterium]